MSTKIPRRISRSNISSDDVVKARWKARRTTVINSSIKLVRSNIPANRSRHSLQRSDKIAFYDSQGATSPFARFQRRKIHAYEIILSNINLASVVAKSTTRIVAPRKKKKKRWINQFVGDGVSLGSGRGPDRFAFGNSTGRREFAFLRVEKTNAVESPHFRDPVSLRETWEARESRLYIRGGGGGVGRRIRSSGSIEGKDPVRRSKKWVEESFQPWNITVSCSSSVYFWLGYFWEVLKECLIFDFETKLHPRSLNHFLHGDINVCLIFMLPANFTAQED